MQAHSDTSAVDPAGHAVVWLALEWHAAQTAQALPVPKYPALQLHVDVSDVDLAGHSTLLAEASHAAQALQSVSAGIPAPVWNVPEVQSLHWLSADAPKRDWYVPAPHLRHLPDADIPVPVWYVPATHLLH